MLELDLIYLAILLALSAFFSGVETALVSLDRVRARQLVKKGSKAAKLIEEFQANPRKLLTTILIGNNVVNIAAAAIATMVAIQVFESHAIGIAVGIMTFLILVFGEITPKSIAVQNAEAISLIAIRPIKILSIVLSPLIWLLNGIAGIVIRVVGAKEQPRLTEQDIKTMVTMGAEAGAIHDIEREMIHRIFRFNDIEVEHVMTPRAEMKVLPHNTTLGEIRGFLAETPYSRIPVFKGKLDKIIGIFYIKDAWDYFAQGKTDTKIEKIAMPVLFVPKTKKIDKLLSQFQREHIHMAIVVGEYGGVLGLVTLEDLLEEIVGEIVDESDVLPAIVKIDNSTFEVSGRAGLKEINRLLRTKWESKEFDTISGLMIEKLDHLPKENEEIAIGKYTLVATKVKEPKILRIKILKKG